MLLTLIYVCEAPLKDKKGVAITNVFQKVLVEFNRLAAKPEGRKPNKIWVHKRSPIKHVRTNLEILGNPLPLSRPIHIWLTTHPPPVHADTRLALFETLQLVNNSH